MDHGKVLKPYCDELRDASIEFHLEENEDRRIMIERVMSLPIFMIHQSWSEIISEIAGIMM